MTAMKSKKEYPDHNPDWLMVDEYARKRSPFGCILCDKTHRKEDCEHKAKRTGETPKQQKKEETYSWYD